MKSVYFKTFGCRTNMFDTAVMMEHTYDFKIVESEVDADVVVVNSCTVTNSADSSVRSYINTQKRANRDVVLTGCGVHNIEKSLLDKLSLKAVVGQSKKREINSILNSKEKIYDVGDLEFIDDAIVSEFRGKSRAFVKIQEGCDFSCSYCIIPSVRGGARSVDELTILRQVEILCQKGFSEFVLTGTNIGSYRAADGGSIAVLMKKIASIDGVKRVRLGSLEPSQIDSEFKELLGESWLEKHLHIALQHTSKKMLKIMNRRNKFSEDLELISDISQRGFAVGTDFIVAHPGESEQVWLEAYENLKQLPLTHIHAFTYSPRATTVSASMRSDVDGVVAKRRLAQVTQLIESNNYTFREQKCNNLDVLIESKEGEYFVGYDQYFNKIRVSSGVDLSGKWIKIDNVDVQKESNYAFR